MRNKIGPKIKRSPVDLRNTGALMSVIRQAMAVDMVRIALSSYIEGRGLPGDWQLEIHTARLVPVDGAEVKEEAS